MQDHQIDKNLFFASDGVLRQISRRVENAGQTGVAIEIRPNVPVILGDREEIREAPCFGFGVERKGSEKEASHHTNGVECGHPVFCNPTKSAHSLPF